MTRRFVVALTIAAWFSSAQAYELLRVNNDPCARGDQNLYWTSATTPVSVDPLPSQYRGLAIEAWQRWNLSVRRFRFRPGSGPGCAIDGTTTISISDQACDQGAFGNDVIAVTRSRWNGDGTLVDADITFRSGTNVLGNSDAFRQVAMHELGHVLGLAHSDDCGGSGAGTLMRRDLTLPLLQAPQMDDVEGADFIYPSSTSGDGTVPPGANSCAIAPQPPGHTLAPPFAALLALLLWRRARRGN